LHNKSESEFSTYKNQNFLRKQAKEKYNAYLSDLRRLLYGQYTPEMQKVLIENKANTYLDSLYFNKFYAQDDQGKEYLSNAVIEEIRQFDMPTQVNKTSSLNLPKKNDMRELIKE
jgi:hypothetical protein